MGRAMERIPVVSAGWVRPEQREAGRQTVEVRVRIGELSRRTGVSGRLLRYYEEQGLLYPQRRSSGYREYREGDVAAVRQIRALLAAGLGTPLIAGVLPACGRTVTISSPPARRCWTTCMRQGTG